MTSIAARSWDRDTVRQALRRYAELCEMYRSAFVASSWPVEMKVDTGPRTWPARFNLLSSKWDIEQAVQRMTPFHQAVFHLRYRLGFSQSRIGRILGCSRHSVCKMLDMMPGRILRLLTTEPSSGGTDHDHDHAAPRLRSQRHFSEPSRRLPSRTGLPDGGRFVRSGGIGQATSSADPARVPAGVVAGGYRRL